MSSTNDDGKGASSGEGSDPIKQIKSEFSRKTDNLTQAVQAQQQKIDAILTAIQSQRAAQNAAAVASEDDANDVDPLDNPKLYAKKVTEAAVRKATEAITSVNAANAAQSARQQTVLNQLVSDYPELNDRSSELFRKAQEIQGGMEEGERFSPVGIRAAVREAAADLGVLPVAKRSKGEGSGDVDDFSVDSSRRESGNQGSGRKKAGKDAQLSPETLAFAELLGRPVKDEKYLERLKDISKTKKFSRYS